MPALETLAPPPTTSSSPAHAAKREHTGTYEGGPNPITGFGPPSLVSDGYYLFLAIARSTILRSSDAISTIAANPMHSTQAIGLNATVPNGPFRNGT